MLFCFKNQAQKQQQSIFQYIKQILYSTEHHWHHHLKT